IRHQTVGVEAPIPTSQKEEQRFDDLLGQRTIRKRLPKVARAGGDEEHAVWVRVVEAGEAHGVPPPSQIGLSYGRLITQRRPPRGGYRTRTSHGPVRQMPPPTPGGGRPLSA